MNRGQDLVEKHRDAIETICRRFGVGRLELFGSAVHGTFDPMKSDLDFIVSFRDRSAGAYADRYLDLALALEGLFGRNVDLLTERSIRNPYFKHQVEPDRALVYEERGQKETA